MNLINECTKKEIELIERKSIPACVRESMEVVNSLVKPSVAPSQPTGENPNKY